MSKLMLHVRSVIHCSLQGLSLQIFVKKCRAHTVLWMWWSLIMMIHLRVIANWHVLLVGWENRYVIFVLVLIRIKLEGKCRKLKKRTSLNALFCYVDFIDDSSCQCSRLEIVNVIMVWVKQPPSIFTLISNMVWVTKIYIMKRGLWTCAKFEDFKAISVPRNQRRETGGCRLLVWKSKCWGAVFSCCFNIGTFENVLNILVSITEQKR